jgi:hypothetical protein
MTTKSENFRRVSWCAPNVVTIWLRAVCTPWWPCTLRAHSGPAVPRQRRCGSCGRVHRCKNARCVMSTELGARIRPVETDNALVAIVASTSFLHLNPNERWRHQRRLFTANTRRKLLTFCHHNRGVDGQGHCYFDGLSRRNF